MSLRRLQLFRARIVPTFEPAGEECGTNYDEATACPVCGSGSTQLGPLVVDVGRIPKRVDFARTIAGEQIVSERVATAFKKFGVSGLAFVPVTPHKAGTRAATTWHQMLPTYRAARIAPLTRTGNDPFDEDPSGEGRCSRGDLIGLNLLSEVSVDASSIGDQDVFATQQFVGVRRGLLCPERVLLMAPKVRAFVD